MGAFMVHLLKANEGHFKRPEAGKSVLNHLSIFIYPQGKHFFV